MQRRFRLRRSADIELLRLEGRRWHHPIAVLILRENGRQVSRFAFSAGRHLGKATVRNRVKRQLREVVRHQLPTVEAGWDCLFVARRSAAEASFGEIEAAISQLLDQAGILKQVWALNPDEEVAVENG